MNYTTLIKFCIVLVCTRVLATPAELASIDLLEKRAQEIITIIDTKSASPNDRWVIDVPSLTIHSDISLTNQQVGPIGMQEILQGLIAAHNERYNQLWILSERARKCCMLIVSLCQQSRMLIAQRTPTQEELLASQNATIHGLQHLKSRINLILYAMSSNETLGKLLYHGNWRLPSPEIVKNAPYFRKISLTIIAYNALPKNILMRAALEATLESLKLVVIRALEELAPKGQ